MALFSGYANVRSKGFVHALSKLSKTQGLLEYPDSKSVRLTQAGITKAGSVTPPSSNEQVHEKIKNLLKETRPRFSTNLSTAFLIFANKLQQTWVTVMSGPRVLPTLSLQDEQSWFLEYVKGDSKKNLIRLTDIAFPLGRPSEATDASANEAPAIHDSSDNVSDELNNATTGTVTRNGTDAVV